MSNLLNRTCSARGGLSALAEWRAPVAADHEVVDQLALDRRMQPRVVLDVHVDVDREDAARVGDEHVDRGDAVRVGAAGASSQAAPTTQPRPSRDASAGCCHRRPASGRPSDTALILQTAPKHARTRPRTNDRRGERRRRKVLQIRLIRPLLARPAHTPNPLTMDVLYQLSYAAAGGGVISPRAANRSSTAARWLRRVAGEASVCGLPIGLRWAA